MNPVTFLTNEGSGNFFDTRGFDIACEFLSFSGNPNQNKSDFIYLVCHETASDYPLLWEIHLDPVVHDMNNHVHSHLFQ